MATSISRPVAARSGGRQTSRPALPAGLQLPRRRGVVTARAAPPLPQPRGRGAGVPPLAAVSVDAPSSSTTGAADASAFTWRSAWYPVAVESYLDRTAPVQVSVLGTETVLWFAPTSPGSDAADTDPPAWRAALDVCPHRLAALSSGRLEGGTLSCRYHGWEFGGDGRCTANPQAADDKAAATVCSSSRARLATLPCRVAQGLVWVWPTPGRAAAAEAEATPLPLYQEAGGGDPLTFPGSDADWGFQVAPVDWTLMAENSLDPSHAPYLHEVVMGRNTRAGAAPCVMKLEGGLRPGGFRVTHGGYTHKQKEEGMVGVRDFTAPGRLRAEYTFNDGRRAIAVIYFTPTKPGYTLTFAKFYQKPASPGGATGGWGGHGGGRASLGARARAWLFGRLARSATFHALTHALADQDNAILHPIAGRLAAAPQGWRAYWLATPADAGVGAFHRWLAAHAGGRPDWDPASPPPPALDRSALLDHYDRHTRYCPSCLAAVARLDGAARALKVVVFAAGLVAAAAAVLAFAASGGGAGGGSGASAAAISMRRVAGAGFGAVVVGSGAAAVRGAVLGLRAKFFQADRLADDD